MTNALPLSQTVKQTSRQWKSLTLVDSNNQPFLVSKAWRRNFLENIPLDSGAGPTWFEHTNQHQNLLRSNWK